MANQTPPTTMWPDMAATYAEQADALDRAAKACRQDIYTRRCYRPIVNLNGWVVAVYEDPLDGDRADTPGFLGYLEGKA